MEINVVNSELLKILDDTKNMFLEREDKCVYYSQPLQDGEPNPDWEQYCNAEWFETMKAKGEMHKGFPEQAYGFQVKHGVSEDPDTFAPLMEWTKGTLPKEFGANSNSLTSYYPKNGFVGWHTNWNAFGYQLILTWSQEGDGYFRYYDNKKDEIITEMDVKGWQARWYRFGRIDEPEHHCWHCAWTNCPRITLAYKFPYGNASEKHDMAYDAIQDMIERLETA